MKKAIITNNKTGRQYAAAMEESELLSWIEKCEQKGTWGKKARESVLIKDLDEYDHLVKLNIRKDDSDNDICDLPQEYQIEISDITVELASQKAKLDAIEYLKNTDWYIIRKMDNGIEVPSEITIKRQQCREIL